MLNIFGYRSTDPKKLKDVADPVGPHNDQFILFHDSSTDKTVAAWGVHGVLNGRNEEVTKMLHAPYCLGKTNGGHPKHPLYLRKDTELELLK